MMIWRRTLQTLAIATLTIFTAGVSDVAADGTVTFNPETSYVLPEQTFNVDIRVDEAVTGTHCYMVTVGFDNSLVELLSVTEGPWLRSLGETFFFWEDNGDNCNLGICMMGYGEYGDGPGVMATLSFRAVASSGTSILDLSGDEFTDVDLQAISVTLIDGAVTISSDQCCLGRVGDANGLGGDEPTIGDVSTIIDAKFITGSCTGILNCLTEADINRSGGIFATCDDITIGDISILIDYLFITGPSLGLPDCL